MEERRESIGQEDVIGSPSSLMGRRIVQKEYNGQETAS